MGNVVQSGLNNKDSTFDPKFECKMILFVKPTETENTQQVCIKQNGQQTIPLHQKQTCFVTLDFDTI